MLVNLPSRSITITSPMGGNGILHIYENQFFRGQVIDVNGVWEVRSHKDDEFTDENKRVIVEGVMGRYI